MFHRYTNSCLPSKRASSRNFHGIAVNKRSPRGWNDVALDAAKDTNNNNNSIQDNRDIDNVATLQRNKDAFLAPLAIFLVSQFLLFIGVGAVIPSIPLYGKALGLSSSANGVVIAAPAVALLGLAKLAGRQADVARKPSMLWGMALIVVADAGTAAAPSLPLLLVARLGLGAGRCISEAGERGFLADWATRVPAWRGRALAAQQAVTAAGIAIGAPLGGMVVENYAGGPRAAFLCVSAAAAISLCLYAFLPETIAGTTSTPTNGYDANDAKSNDAAMDDSSSSSPTISWRELLQDDRWRALCLCQAGATFGFCAKIASVPVLAAAILPGGAVGAGALVSACGLMGLVGAPVGGYLTDRWGARDTAVASGMVSALALLLIPVALATTSTTITTDSSPWGLLQWPMFTNAGMTPQAASFVALVLLWSLGATAQTPALTAVAQTLAPRTATATAMALPRATGDGTYIVAPFLLGLTSDFFASSTLSSTGGGLQGVDCALAGLATLIGALGLFIMRGGGNVKKDTKIDTDGA